MEKPNTLTKPDRIAQGEKLRKLTTAKLRERHAMALAADKADLAELIVAIVTGRGESVLP